MNKHLLIGSRALNYWFPEVKVAPETDWDVITYSELYGIERHDPDFLNNKDLIDFTNDCDKVLYRGYWLYVVNPEGLAAVKRSHLWRSLSFDKHITHYVRHLKLYFNPDSEFFKTRLEMSYKAFPQQKVNLNVPVQEFFDDYVTKKYNHDWLHELFAHEHVPLYKQMQVDTSKAWCEKDLWYNFSHRQKVNCISEEVYVIASERFLVPSNWGISYKVAYHRALNKVCTTLTSGWFRDFAIDNYAEIYDNIQVNKFESVKLILEKERI